MDVRFTTDPDAFKKLTNEEINKKYLINDLFAPDEIRMIYTDIDRAIVGSAVPVKKDLQLMASKKEMSAEYFTERREIGIINIGGEGIIEADKTEFKLAFKDALYIGKGVKDIKFKAGKSDKYPKYYFVSYPAHKEYPTVKINFADAVQTKLGSQSDANKRTIFKLIVAGKVQTCQLAMGLTELEDGSVWNTMPPHTHQRRSEVYMYYEIEPNAMVIHFIGTPNETRHLMIRNEQAVLSPSWSIHTGVGTHRYSFIWAMGGENQEFDDMDGISIDKLH